MEGAILEVPVQFKKWNDKFCSLLIKLEHLKKIWGDMLFMKFLDEEYFFLRLPGHWLKRSLFRPKK